MSQQLICRKCPYYDRNPGEGMVRGSVIVGLCKLRNMLITDVSISKEFCKDRAVVPAK
jgi:hypothetical protein